MEKEPCRRCAHSEAFHAIGPKNPNAACTSGGCRCKAFAGPIQQPLPELESPPRKK
jgi:hypothetical protein